MKVSTSVNRGIANVMGLLWEIKIIFQESFGRIEFKSEDDYLVLGRRETIKPELQNNTRVELGKTAISVTKTDIGWDPLENTIK